MDVKTPLNSPVVTVVTFDETQCNISYSDEPSAETIKGITWINVEGLHDIERINKLAKRFSIHPLTVEDIINSDKRPKVEEYIDYIFFTIKLMEWGKKTSVLNIQQVSIIFGKDFILSFHESPTTVFEPIYSKLKNIGSQGLRQRSTDYLAYRLIDVIVDDYFDVLEGLGEQIESMEDRIIVSPSPKNARIIYRIKREMLLIRKAIWPVREAISHLLYEENSLVTSFTRIYLRNVYDHIMQSMDTIETCRDMLASVLDMYLSGLTIRMNEIVKTLTIITTIFIPISALAGIYGMNLPDIPFMKSKWGFVFVGCTMIGGIISMILYFRKKKWI